MKAGKHKNLILLHGYGFDHAIFQLLTPALEKQGFTCFSPDLPGFGSSPVPEDYSMSALAVWLEKFVENHAIDDFAIIAHSMGGYMALNYLADRRNNSVRGLFMLHSHAFADTEEKQQDRLKKVNFMKQHGKQAFLDLFYPSVFKDGVPVDFSGLQHRYTADIPVEVLCGYMEAMANRADYSAFIKETKLPIVIYHGKHDKLMPKSHALSMAAQIHTGHIHLDEASGHMAMWENPEGLAKVIANGWELM